MKPVMDMLFDDSSSDDDDDLGMVVTMLDKIAMKTQVSQRRRAVFGCT
jgi:hypothetical protein